jgi:hypothetical protein
MAETNFCQWFQVSAVQLCLARKACNRNRSWNSTQQSNNWHPTKLRSNKLAHRNSCSTFYFFLHCRLERKEVRQEALRRGLPLSRLFNVGSISILWRPNSIHRDKIICFYRLISIKVGTPVRTLNNNFSACFILIYFQHDLSQSFTFLKILTDSNGLNWRQCPNVT